jgi:tetrahydromethanopterin S-methyltransferase subunit H
VSDAKTLSKLRTVRIGDVTIGGDLGEYPTVVMLSIFHQGDRTVTDQRTGQFDKARAHRYIDRALKLSATTGNPVVLDVLAQTPTAMQQYLAFLAEAAPSVPFLIDSTSKDAGLAGIQFVAEHGRANLAIYDSIGVSTTAQELEALRNTRIEAAILLAHNSTSLQPKGRLDILRGTSHQEGLLAKAAKAGITKPLVDTVALDLAGLSIAGAAIPLVKHELGLPVGAGPANSVAIWRRGARISRAAKRYLAPALCTYLQCCGANFLLPGPIRRAPRFFAAIAVTDALLAYAPPDGSPPRTPKTRLHPRFTVL